MRALLNLTTALLRCTLAFFRSRKEQAMVEFALRQRLALSATTWLSYASSSGSAALPALPGREVMARVWLARVGRVPLLLLDTDIADNDSAGPTWCA